MVSGHCTILLEHVITMRTSCFDTDFVLQVKMTSLPLIHCFWCPGVRGTLPCDLSHDACDVPTHLTPRGQNDWRTDACKNITFSQLCLPAVLILPCHFNCHSLARIFFQYLFRSISITKWAIHYKSTDSFQWRSTETHYKYWNRTEMYQSKWNYLK